MAVNDGREVWTGSFDRTIKVTDRRATARSPKEVRKPLCLPLPAWHSHSPRDQIATLRGHRDAVMCLVDGEDGTVWSGGLGGM